MKECTRSGFTLIELSIVLVIIGLLSAGILVGRDLIRAAELRSVVTDAEEYGLAINTFWLKYNALPGDMTNATDLWGSDDLCPDDSTTPDTPKMATCNGNGDGMIRNMTLNTQAYEVFRAVQQLSNAGMIAGFYTGVSGGNFTYNTETGKNIPKLTNFEAGMLMVHNDTKVSGDHLYPSAFRLMIHIGGDFGNGWNYKKFLSAYDAYSIDSKTDNGLPGSGKWMTYKPGSYPDNIEPYCSTSPDPALAVYNLDARNEISCALVYIVQRD